SAIAVASAASDPPALTAPAAVAATPSAQRKPPLRTPLSAEGVETLRRFSQCMRERGLLEYPDPSPNGELALPEAYLNPGAELRSRLVWGGSGCKRMAARGAPGAGASRPGARPRFCTCHGFPHRRRRRILSCDGSPMMRGSWACAHVLTPAG